MKKCAAPDCEKPHLAKGYCSSHYSRMRRYGDLTVRPPRPGVTKHPMYGAWCGMIGRCENQNHTDYPKYGARGIKVCSRWRHDFTVFLADMGERPSGKTLDRIDPDGSYSPENCRWATPAEQRRNLSLAGDARQRDGARAGALKRHHGENYDKNAADL